MQKQKNLCALCKHIANNSCGSCGAVHYCSRDHQISHWQTHLKNCPTYKLVENSQIGRHYVATRKIKVGKTIIHDKTPLVTAPQNLGGIGMPNSNFAITLKISPVCLSCYVVLKGDNAKLCKCGWHLCRKCTKHGTECEFTEKYARSKALVSKAEYGQPHPAYEIIGVTRALALRENDPESYRKLMSLRDPIRSTLTSKLLPEDSICKAAQFAKSFFKIDDVQEDEICEIMRIILVYSYIVPSTGESHRALYDAPSYVENSCRPNCSKSVTEEGGIMIWAAVPISKGDHITVSYVPPLWSTPVRRKNLASIKFLDCECERCKDPTEFGTMFSAMKCREEKCGGCMIPPTFLVTEDDFPDYVCSKCSITKPWKSFWPVEQLVCMHWTTMDKTNVRECRNFLAKWKNVLPENHFHIVDIEIDLVFAIGLRSRYLTKRPDKCLKDLVKLCTKLTELLQTLAPAENQFRGALLYVHSRANDLLNSKTRKEQNLERHIKFLMKHTEMLNEVHQLLHREPSFCDVEKSIAEAVLEEMRQMHNLPEIQLMLAACSI